MIVETSYNEVHTPENLEGETVFWAPSADIASSEAWEK